MKFETAPQNEEISPKNASRRDFLKLIGKAALGAAAGTKVFKTLEGVAHASEREEDDLSQKWLEIRKALEESRAGENLSYLRNKFGPAADALLYKASLDAQLFQSLQSRKVAGKDTPVFENDFLILRRALDTFKKYWDKREAEERLRRHEETEGLDATFHGFDAKPEWSNDLAKNLLEKKFNKRWLYSTVGNFSFMDRVVRKAHYLVAGKAKGTRAWEQTTKCGCQHVEIYELPLANDPNWFLEIMAHEVAHHQDWGTSVRLTIPERLEFLREVTERFEDYDNRWHTEYLDTFIPKEFEPYIQKGQYDKRDLLYRQVREYWAVLAEICLAKDQEIKNGIIQLPAQDIALFKKWYERLTKDYGVNK